MKLDPAKMNGHGLMQALSTALAPRPVVLVATVSRDHAVNLAPFSSVTPLSAWPPLAGVVIHPRSDGTLKTTLRNVRETGELVINTVPLGLASRAVDLALEPADAGAPSDRFELLPSDVVRPPRVAESPLQLECRLVEILIPKGSQASLVVAEVVRVHVDDALVREGVLSVESIRPLGHLGVLALGTHAFTTSDRIICITRSASPDAATIC